MSAPVIERSTLFSFNFTLVAERANSCVYVDETHGIVKITWFGKVDQQTAITIIHALVKQMQAGICNKILVTREDNSSFTVEAIEWMRGFLLDNRYRFRFKVARIAGVTPEAGRANIFANFIKTAIQVIFPGVKISNFEFEDSALAWLG